MKEAISKNKFLSAICAVGLGLILACAIMLSACATFTVGEMRLGKAAPYGFVIDSTGLTLTAVEPAVAEAGETNYKIEVTGAVTELSVTDFGQLYKTANTKGRLVVLFTLTITQEMMNDPDSVIIIDDCYKYEIDEDNELDQTYELNEDGVVDSLPTYGRDGYIYVICNTAGDAISNVSLEYKKTKADGTLEATKTVINYVIDFTGITKATTPAP